MIKDNITKFNTKSFYVIYITTHSKFYEYKFICKDSALLDRIKNNFQLNEKGEFIIDLSAIKNIYGPNFRFFVNELFSNANLVLLKSFDEEKIKSVLYSLVTIINSSDICSKFDKEHKIYNDSYSFYDVLYNKYCMSKDNEILLNMAGINYYSMVTDNEFSALYSGKK